MANYIGDNLRRLMAKLGLTIEQVVAQSGLDRRTILGILGGSKAHMRTINRLAQGLGVSTDEFFLDPSQLLYRQFDQWTNPVVQEVIDAHPEMFTGWTAAQFAELHSRFGDGGALTFDGAMAAVRHMNANRAAFARLAMLLESHRAEAVRGILEVCFNDANLTGGIDEPCPIDCGKLPRRPDGPQGTAEKSAP